MKDILIALISIVCFQIIVNGQSGFVDTSQNSNFSSGSPKIEFESNTVDYGTVQKNSDPIRIIKFKNIGNLDLIISNARGNCGCTVPNWPAEAIKPGETGEIEISYSTDRVGEIDKKVTVTTNESNDNIHLIYVKGIVLGDD